MLEADGFQRADEAKVRGSMQRNRGRIRRIADYRDHLPEAAGPGVGDQPCDQQPAQSLTVELRIDIDRILDAPAVGRVWKWLA
jgi:hypothetical protein